MRTLRRLRNRFLGRLDGQWYVERGLVLGERVHIGPGVRLDPEHCWLITIGDDAALAPNVTVLAHDASTKRHLGHAAIGKVTIGARTFIGAGATILPGVTIGEDSIVGAGSLVTSDVPARSVAVGSPAKVVSTLDEFVERHRKRMAGSPVYDESWTSRASVPSERKTQMRREVGDAGGGYIV